MMTSVAEQMIEALWIMVLGMVLVYLFLGILILGLKLIERRFAPQPISGGTVPQADDKAMEQCLDPRLVMAISSAIQQHRAREGRS